MDSLLRLLLILSIIASSCYTGISADEKVNVSLYYESLCPFSSNLISNHLYRLFESDIASVTNIKFIPYGNAKISQPNNTITCQHGPDECLLNTAESCAIDAYPAVKDHFWFIHCVESMVYKKNYTDWQTCFKKSGLDAARVTRCMNSDSGKKLELAYAAETSALNPPHKFVPWLVVNGQPVYDDYRDFVTYICKAYKGTTKPKACSPESLFISRMKMNIARFLNGDDAMTKKLKANATLIA